MMMENLTLMLTTINDVIMKKTTVKMMMETLTLTLTTIKDMIMKKKRKFVTKALVLQTVMTIIIDMKVMPGVEQN